LCGKLIDLTAIFSTWNVICEQKTKPMSRKIKMLIVEDNEDERLFMKEGFIQTGLYEVIGEAENGNEMLKLFREPMFPLPEVILSDLNMPGRNGYEVIVDVKSNSALSHIPIIILTTAPEVPYAERCKTLGACAYYTKPNTFLEYKNFAEQIYGDVKLCIGDGKVEYSGVNLSRSLQNVGSMARSLFYRYVVSRLFRNGQAVG
jgi:CheY-like chemotaxis protein